MTDKLIRLFIGMLIVAFLSAIAAIWTGDARFSQTSFVCTFFGLFGLIPSLMLKAQQEIYKS